VVVRIPNGVLPLDGGTDVTCLSHVHVPPEGGGEELSAEQLAIFDVPASTFDREREWVVRELGSAGGKFETARHWVEAWHYSHRMPAPGTRTYGLFCPDMACCVMVSWPTNVHGIATRYDLHQWHGNMEISRVVAHPDAPRNTASRALSAVFDLYRQWGYDWLFSYADTGQNHHGGIYQALNAVYVGLSDARPGFLHDGQPLHPRMLVDVYGTQAWPRVQEIAERAGHTLERIDGLNSAKHTYVLPIGGPAVRRAIRRHLAPVSLPYPKRT
jgi:hypothetical protein